MERVKRFLRKVAERAKAVFTHKSEGFNDMVMIATAIISVVIVAMIGVYISSQIYNVMQLSTTSPFNTAMNAAIGIMNTTFPLITVIVIAVVAGTIMVYLLGGFGVGGGRREGRSKTLFRLASSPPLSCQHYCWTLYPQNGHRTFPLPSPPLPIFSESE